MATPELHDLDPITSPSGFACCRSTWLGRLLTWYEVGYLGYCWWIEREVNVNKIHCLLDQRYVLTAVDVLSDSFNISISQN